MVEDLADGSEKGRIFQRLTPEPARRAYPDPTDRAALEADRNFLLRIRDRERKLIEKIKEALERIDNGSFGICEVCGRNIGQQRLKARPVTTLCIGCKKKQEAREKARGL